MITRPLAPLHHASYPVFVHHLVPRVRAVIIRQLFKRVGLCRVEKRPQVIFREVLLKHQLRGLLLFAMLSPHPPSTFSFSWLAVV